jgi:RimJ/RimL family protein N-acetyltransferase
MAILLPIETERLLIRLFEPNSDAAGMAAVYCDPEVVRFIPGGALAGEADVRATLERYARLHEQHCFGSWAIVERKTGELVGDVGFGVFGPTGDVEIGYTLARDHWGRGLATEAASACLAAGLAHLPVRRIIAVVDVENAAWPRG